MAVHVLKTMGRREPANRKHTAPGVQTPQKKTEKVIVRDMSESKKVEVKDNSTQEKKVVEQSETLKIISESMEKKCVIKFVYESHDEMKEREVEPYKLMISNKGELTVYAFCRNANAIRAFTVSKIVGIQKTDTQYEPKWPIENLVSVKEPEKSK